MFLPLRVASPRPDLWVLANSAAQHLSPFIFFSLLPHSPMLVRLPQPVEPLQVGSGETQTPLCHLLGGKERLVARLRPSLPSHACCVLPSMGPLAFLFLVLGMSL